MTLIPLITGIGLATPLGTDFSQNWSALYDGRSIRDHERVGGFDRTPRLQELAVRVALEARARGDTSVDETRDQFDPVALVVGTSKGPVTDWLSPHASARAGGTSDNHHPAGGADPGSLTPAGLSDDAFGLAGLASHVARRLRLNGSVVTLSAACASGLHALIRATLMVERGEVRRALVVAAESSVHPLFLGCFGRLGVLAAEGDGCRPFDTARSGFLVSEAAAAVWIEGVVAGEPIPDRVGRKALARIERYALGADATHLTGGDPEAGPLRRLLARVVDGRPLDLIHAHGTGTILNDPVELAAIESVVAPSETPPHVYSHKGALGHSLGASGLVAVVFNCAAHRKGVVLPNVRTTSPLPTRRVLIRPETCHRPIRRSLAIAAGFGGAMAAVSLVGM